VLPMSLLIKICGMRDASNIQQILTLPIDYIGFIFYPKSPRYVSSPDEFSAIQFPESLKKVGVFVNADAIEIMQKVKIYDLHTVQLHGNESVQLCQFLHSQGVEIIKAFQIQEESDFKQVLPYQTYVDYFLFDTQTNDYGGSGKKFDWQLLKSYQATTPFFLSGGIAHEDVLTISKLKHSLLAGIDLNSRFETSPGIKNYPLLASFIYKIKTT